MAGTLACRDCTLCTGRAFTGAGRQMGRRTADIATLGVSALVRRKCRGCGHAMSEHAGQAGEQVAFQPAYQPSGPPPGWYQDNRDGRFDRWWDGQRWTEHLQQRRP